MNDTFAAFSLKSNLIISFSVIGFMQKKRHYAKIEQNISITYFHRKEKRGPPLKNIFAFVRCFVGVSEASEDSK